MRTLLPLALPPLFCMLALRLDAQAPAAPQGRDPAVDKLIKELREDVMDKKLAKDDAASKAIDELLKLAHQPAPKAMSAKDKEAFATALGEIFTKAAPRAPEKKGLYVDAATALGQLGSAGTKALLAAYDDSKFTRPPWVELRATVLRALGKTKDVAAKPELMKVVGREDTGTLLAAAGEALGDFAGAPLPARKDIAGALIKRLNGIDAESKANVDPTDANVKNARDRLTAIQDAWNQTLGKLTHQDFRTPGEWEKWHNKNKDGDWDKSGK